MNSVRRPLSCNNAEPFPATCPVLVMMDLTMSVLALSGAPVRLYLLATPQKSDQLFENGMVW